MAQTTVVMSSDETKLLAGLQKTIAAQDKMIAKFKQAGAQGKSAGKAAEESTSRSNAIIRQGVRALKDYALGYIGVQQGINLVNRELQAQLKFQQEIRDANINVAGSQAQIIKNLSGASTTQKREVNDAIERIQAETSFPELAQLNLAGASGLSASSGNVPATLDALRASARLSRDSPDEIGTFVGGALDIQKASGVDDARKNLGFLLSVGGQARIESPQLQAKNIAPAVGSIVGTVDGDRIQASREAGALFAALTTAAVDTTGEPTRTASTGLAVQLREFFAENGNDPGTIAGRIDALQGDAKLRQAFLDDASFEKRFQIPIEQLLSGGATARSFDQALNEIKFDAQQFEQVATELSTLTDELRSRSDSDALKSNTEQFRIGADLVQRRADAREALEESLKAAYGDEFDLGLGEFLNLTSFDIQAKRSENPEQVAIDIIEAQMRAVRTGTVPFSQRTDDQLQSDELQALELMQKNIRILRERADAEAEAIRVAEGRTLPVAQLPGAVPAIGDGVGVAAPPPLTTQEQTALLQSIDRNTRATAQNGQGNVNGLANAQAKLGGGVE